MKELQFGLWWQKTQHDGNAVRYLLIRNMKPERWPRSDPPEVGGFAERGANNPKYAVVPPEQKP